MLKTIEIGNYLSIQGRLEEMLSDGLCRVRVGARIFTGRLIST
ncbi:hypothetical protein [Jannaschia donghaensis]|uniref:Uncharacterized protein n=1 Tax=Jannaschia donghaensis TaxID=420998 RepID=A0A0M6YJ35_9RHOB|nr:hypothetical protein [Jannaschia donghaensis]CTQ49287.1 hypothetical protein JDO7802_01300 [Jannaschia donghaensis]